MYLNYSYLPSIGIVLVLSIPLRDSQQGLFAEALLDDKVFGEICAEGSRKIDLNWDVGCFNRHSVQWLQRFQRLERNKADFEEECAVWHNVGGLITSSISQTTRVFMFGNPSQHDWYLGCTSSAVALHICRLNQDMDTTDVARHLLGRGFRFHTFARVPSEPPPPYIPLVHGNDLKRYRPSVYQWSKQDYDSWLGALKTFLKSSRGRAVFMRGGLLWRIAMEFALPDHVIPGPSREARQGMGIVRRDSSNRNYVDDELSAEEIDFICGVHYVYMKAIPKKEETREPPITEADLEPNLEKLGAASPCLIRPLNDSAEVAPDLLPPPPPQEQLQRMSYFPPEDVWLDMYGLFNGWPEDAEMKFVKNKAELKANGFQPTSRAIWKRRLRKSGAVMQVAWRLERASDIAINEARQSFDHTS